MRRSAVAALSTTTLADRWKGQMILAPLTRGGNVPFRRLCQDFGCRVSMGEMIFARHLIKGDPVEQARLRRVAGDADHMFGVQIATNDAAEGAAAMALAAAAGADFVDLNTGCPLYEATRRGLGSALLRNPSRLQSLVHDMIQQNAASCTSSSSSPIPLTVKVRLGCEADTINIHALAEAVRNSGASALTIHGRTAQQGYKQSADWNLIQQVAQANRDADDSIPVVGNGDILTHYEAQRHLDTAGVHAVMVGRGALIKPWIFQEFHDQRPWYPTVQDRVAVYRRLACYMKEYFGNDEIGKKSAWRFLPWHFDFLSRYMPLPESEYGEQSKAQPLIQTRLDMPHEMIPLETVLCNRNVETHDRISHILWEADSDADAVSKLSSFAESADFFDIVQGTNKPVASGDAAELSNIPAKKPRRRVRTPKPKRTPEEIEAIRAERAAKRAATGSTYVHVNGRRRESEVVE